MKYLSQDGVKYLWSKIKSTFTLKSDFDAGVVNENMLINSNFAWPVNQRRQTMYPASVQTEYTIDRWQLAYTNMQVSVMDTYIRLKTTAQSDMLLIRQYVEMSTDAIPEVMTLSFRAKASANSKFDLYETGRHFVIGTAWKTYSITFKKSELGNSLGPNFFIVYLGIKPNTDGGETKLPSGRVLDIAWAKLEAGAKATTYVPPNYEEELQKCRRYFVKYYSWNNAILTRGDNNNLVAYIPNLFMRINPSVRYAGIKTSGMTGTGVVADKELTTVSATLTHTDGTQIYFTLSGNPINYGVGMFIKDIELDAEYH